MEVNEYAKLYLDVKTRMFVGHKLSIRDHNKSDDYENNNKYRQKAKNLAESARKSVEAI